MNPEDRFAADDPEDADAGCGDTDPDELAELLDQMPEGYGADEHAADREGWD